MNSLNVKEIKFFKAKEMPKKRNPNNKLPANKEDKTNFWERIIKNPFFYLFLFVLAITYFISYVPSRTLPQLEAGEIATVDIEVPSDIPLIDSETTNEKKKEEVDAVLPVYNLDTSIFSNTEEKIRSLFQSGRELIKNPITEDIIQNFSISLINQHNLELDSNNLNALIRLA